MSKVSLILFIYLEKTSTGGLLLMHGEWETVFINKIHIKKEI